MMAEAKHGNFQSCCRLCLSDKIDGLKPIFGADNKDVSMQEKIQQFVDVQVQVEDKLSIKICDQCIMKVNHWHAYRQRCVRNQNKLIQWMNNHDQVENHHEENMNVKLEPKESAQQESMSTAIMDQSIVIKPEPMEVMELEYDEFPSQDSSNNSDLNFKTENDPGSDDESTRRCRVCFKLFSSNGNKKKHEKNIHGIHGFSRKSILNDIPLKGQDYDEPADLSPETNEDQQESPSTSSQPDLDQEKIQYCAGLKLIEKNSTPISMEPLSKIEASYIEKCKAMLNMHNTLECACHNVTHLHLKGLLSHLRALRIWFPVFTCYNCMITFTDRSTFTKHNVKCPSTHLETLTKLSNLKKRSEVKTRLYQNFRCTSCKFMYSFHEDFIRHVDEDHSNVALPYVCTCKRSFDKIEDYKDHIYVSCMVDYYCDICFITTKTLEGFQKHAVNVHDNCEGFVLLQDDNYKARRSISTTPTSKEIIDESVIVTGKRERRASHRILNSNNDYEENGNGNVIINPFAVGKTQNKSCPICFKEYSSYNNMMRHYRTHKHKGIKIKTEESYYSCPECGGVYNENEWQLHLNQNHSPIKCNDCDKVFQFQKELDQHRSVHLNLKVYKDSKTKLYKSTMLSKPKEKIDRLSCLSCNKTYASYAGLWEHNKSKHPEKKTPYENSWPRKCDHCSKICNTGAALHRHKMIHVKKVPQDGNFDKKSSEEDEESYHTCKKCFKVFSNKYNLKNHLKCHGITVATKKTVKKEVIKQERMSDEDEQDEEDIVLTKDKVPLIYTCDVCVMTFSSRNALRKHKEQHELEDHNPFNVKKHFNCKHCKIQFTSIALYNKHMESEHEESVQAKSKNNNMNFVCHVCKKSFKTSAALTTHVGWHKRGQDASMLTINNKPPKLLKQDKTGVQFKCTTCSAVLPNDTALQVHILENHRSVSAIMLPPRCNICSKDFNTQEDYENHKRYHDFLERQKQHELKNKFQMLQFKCHYCDRVFDKQNSLSIHLKIHEKQISVGNSTAGTNVPSKYSCSICNMGFNLPKDLRAHTINAHPF